MNTLYLTANEKKLFGALAKELREGWEVEDATIAYEETAAKRLARFQLLRVQSPTLQGLQEKAKNAKTKEDVDALLREFNIEDVNEVDMTEILYAMGPDLISGMLEHALQNVKTDEDIEGVAGISTMRHLLFSSQTVNA